MADHDPERELVDILIGALTGSTLLPFFQAIASKSGEDVYAKLKHLLTRRGRKRARAELEERGTVTLVSTDTRIVLRLPATMTATMTEQLAQVRLPPRGDEWLRVSWDQTKARWVTFECDPPDERT